jgi:hypothetical protein
MIAVFEPDLSRMKVIPEMRNNKALASGWHPNGGKLLRSARICLPMLLGLSMPALLAAAEESAWLTGQRIEQQLSSRVQALHWGANPLRSALDSLARSQRIAIFLDRRVDPGQPVDFSVQNEPLRAVIQRLAQSLGLGAGRVGPVVYLGPWETASVLEAVVELRRSEVRRWPPAVSKRLLTTQPVAWPELAEPRELISHLVQQAGLEIEGLHQVPHDLWPAADLPPLDFVEQLSLLLAGFGLTFEPLDAGPAVRLVRLPDAKTGHPSVTESPIHRKQPAKPVKPSKQQHPADSQIRYTLEIKNQPVGAVAKALAERVGLQIEFDPQIRESLDKRVSFHVEEASLEVLLEALFEPAGLSHRIVGDTLTVLAAPDGP